MNPLLRTSLLCLVASTLAATAVSQTQPLLTHHVRHVTQNGEAKALGQLPAAQTLHLTLTLPLRNQPELDTLLDDLYNPASPSYRHFLTVEQFTAEFGPTEDDYNTLINFAQERGLTVVATSPNRLNLDVTGSVAAIQQAFHLNLRTYQHPTENRAFFSPDREPTVDLPFQLWHIAGLDNYSIPHPAGLMHNPNVNHGAPSATVGSGPSASFLGTDMRAAYYGGGSLTGSGQYLGLLEYYGTDLADLQTYYSHTGQTYPGSAITLLSTDGTSTSCTEKSGCDDTEQTLDMTQALGMAPGLSGLVMYVGSTDSAIFNAMATHKPLNAQLSSSWTWYPADPSTDNPYFEEFAAQGQNLFQAAGDSSKWTTSGTASEIFPADDVYITSVGGTDLSTSSAAGPWASETGWSDSGGGISPNKFAIPSWQTTAASSCSSCSKTYRNGPDVSANANFTFYVCADQTTCTANDYGGTSFAAPMWAGFLALVNQQYAVANPQKSLGFINPALYDLGDGSSYDTDFHDITSGSNGYSATVGYDLNTGWGSPTASLVSALAGSSTQNPGFSLSASPSSVSIAQGSEGSSTITSSVTGGFDSAIALSYFAPSGMTVSFNPGSITGAGTSSMSISVASTVATGTYNITVTGTSGSTVETTTVSVTVTGTTAGFSLSANPTSITIARSSSGDVTITTTATGGFDSPITLSASGEGGANSVSFSPSTITGAGTSTMKITVGRNAATGDHTITVTGTSGGTKHTSTVTLDVIR